MTTHWTSPVTGRVVRLHWNSWMARLGGANNCMTLTAHDIFVASDWIYSMTLAHEDGHTVQAAKRGVLYLPWVLLGYLHKGYAHAKAEREADDFMYAHGAQYRSLGNVPTTYRSTR